MVAGYVAKSVLVSENTTRRTAFENRVVTSACESLRVEIRVNGVESVCSLFLFRTSFLDRVASGNDYANERCVGQPRSLLGTIRNHTGYRNRCANTYARKFRDGLRRVTRRIREFSFVHRIRVPDTYNFIFRRRSG